MSNYTDPYPENAKLAAENGYDRHLYLEQLGIPLKECGVNFLSNTDKRYKDWQNFKALYNVDPRATWQLYVAYIEWIYENVKAYKELAQEFVDLNCHTFEIENETYTQKQVIGMILSICEEYFKGSEDYRINCNVIYDTCKKISDLFIEIINCMWW